MNKFCILSIASIVSVLTLSSCGGNTSTPPSPKPLANPQVTTSTQSTLNGDIPQRDIVRRAIVLNVLSGSSLQLQQQEPEVFKKINTYSVATSAVATTLKTDTATSQKVILKYSKPLEEYRSLLNKEVPTLAPNPTNSNTSISSGTTTQIDNTQSISPITISPEVQKKIDTNTDIKDFEKYFENNLANEGVSITPETLRSLALSPEVTSMINLQKEVWDYILPDGTPVDKQTKQTFDAFKESMAREQSPGWQPMSDLYILEEYKKVVHDSQMQQAGRCDAIIDGMTRSLCESMKKQ